MNIARDGLFAVESSADDRTISGQEGDFIAGTEAEDGAKLFEFFFGQGDGFGGVEVRDLDKCAGEGAEGNHWHYFGLLGTSKAGMAESRLVIMRGGVKLLLKFLAESDKSRESENGHRCRFGDGLGVYR